jgi:hypothetical protein
VGRSVKAGSSRKSSGAAQGAEPGGSAGDATGGAKGGEAAVRVGTDKQPGAGASQRDCDPVIETAVLLDSVIHDLRTPLSAMSGWLEVLEAHFGEADGIVGRALLGLRRGVDSQTAGLSHLSDVLMKQRMDLPLDGDCVLLERMRQALDHLESQPDSPVDRHASARLAPLKALQAAASLKCQDAGSSLNDACGTLLHALAVAQDAADGPLSIAADEDKVVISVPGGSGDQSALRSLCNGLAGFSGKRPEIRAPALWLARSMLQRCGLAMQMKAVPGGGFDLLLSRSPQAS